MHVRAFCLPFQEKKIEKGQIEFHISLKIRYFVIYFRIQIF